MKLSRNTSAFALMAIAAIATFFIGKSNHNSNSLGDQNTFDPEKELILSRAMHDVAMNFLLADDEDAEIVKVFDHNDILLGTYTLQDFRIQQASAQIPRANYLSEMNNLMIYKVLD